jgi:hypothetical protein
MSAVTAENPSHALVSYATSAFYSFSILRTAPSTEEAIAVAVGFNKERARAAVRLMAPCTPSARRTDPARCCRPCYPDIRRRIYPSLTIWPRLSSVSIWLVTLAAKSGVESGPRGVISRYPAGP